MTRINRSLLEEGLPHPRGATWTGSGTNFALFCANATKVELRLFESSDANETDRTELPEYSDQVVHGWLPDVGPDSFYGYRVHGPYEPGAGARLNDVARLETGKIDVEGIDLGAPMVRGGTAFPSDKRRISCWR
jgi:isoamylase